MGAINSIERCCGGGAENQNFQAYQVFNRNPRFFGLLTQEEIESNRRLEKSMQMLQQSPTRKIKIQPKYQRTKKEHYLVQDKLEMPGRWLSATGLIKYLAFTTLEGDLFRLMVDSAKILIFDKKGLRQCVSVPEESQELDEGTLLNVFSCQEGFVFVYKKFEIMLVWKPEKRLFELAKKIQTKNSALEKDLRGYSPNWDQEIIFNFLEKSAVMNEIRRPESTSAFSGDPVKVKLMSFGVKEAGFLPVIWRQFSGEIHLLVSSRENDDSNTYSIQLFQFNWRSRKLTKRRTFKMTILKQKENPGGNSQSESEEDSIQAGDNPSELSGAPKSPKYRQRVETEISLPGPSSSPRSQPRGLTHSEATIPPLISAQFKHKITSAHYSPDEDTLLIFGPMNILKVTNAFQGSKMHLIGVNVFGKREAEVQNLNFEYNQLNSESFELSLFVEEDNNGKFLLGNKRLTVSNMELTMLTISGNRDCFGFRWEQEHLAEQTWQCSETQIRFKMKKFSRWSSLNNCLIGVTGKKGGGVPRQVVVFRKAEDDPHALRQLEMHSSTRDVMDQSKISDLIVVKRPLRNDLVLVYWSEIKKRGGIYNTNLYLVDSEDAVMKSLNLFSIHFREKKFKENFPWEVYWLDNQDIFVVNMSIDDFYGVYIFDHALNLLEKLPFKETEKTKISNNLLCQESQGLFISVESFVDSDEMIELNFKSFSVVKSEETFQFESHGVIVFQNLSESKIMEAFSYDIEKTSGNFLLMHCFNEHPDLDLVILNRNLTKVLRSYRFAVDPRRLRIDLKFINLEMDYLLVKVSKGAEDEDGSSKGYYLIDLRVDDRHEFIRCSGDGFFIPEMNLFCKDDSFYHFDFDEEVRQLRFDEYSKEDSSRQHEYHDVLV